MSPANNAPDPVLTLDSHGRVRLLNGAAERLLGISGAEARGRRLEELPFGGAERGGEAEADRRQALLEAAEELTHVGSWDWTPAESWLVWSDNLFRIFALEPDELTPTPEYVFAQTHQDDRERVVRKVEELAASGRLQPLDYRIVRADRVVRHLRATLAVAERRDGEPYRLIGWVQDITERRRAEREIGAHVAVAAALTAWDSLARGAERLLAGLAQALDCSAGVFWVPQAGVLAPRVLWHSDGVALPDFEAVTRRTRLAPGSELPGRAWQCAQPAGAVSILDAPITPRRQAATRAELRGGLAFPALHDAQVLAVVELASREEAELTPRLMRSLSVIGAELGDFLARRRGELGPPLLTARELEVLQLAAEGLSARQAAERLFLAEATVRTHLEHIYAKLHVGDKASAVAQALRQGLIA